MKKISFIFFMLCFLVKAQQKNDSIIYISSQSLDYKGGIRQKIANIILSKESINLETEEDKLKYLNRHFYIKEILDKSFLKDNSKGIFIIIPSASHSPYYLLLLDNKTKIVDFKHLDILISKVLKYCSKTNLPDEKKYNYLMEVLKFYKINENQINRKRE